MKDIQWPKYRIITFVEMKLYKITIGYSMNMTKPMFWTIVLTSIHYIVWIREKCLIFFEITHRDSYKIFTKKNFGFNWVTREFCEEFWCGHNYIFNFDSTSAQHSWHRWYLTTLESMLGGLSKIPPKSRSSFWHLSHFGLMDMLIV